MFGLKKYYHSSIKVFNHITWYIIFNLSINIPYNKFYNILPQKLFLSATVPKVNKQYSTILIFSRIIIKNGWYNTDLHPFWKSDRFFLIYVSWSAFLAFPDTSNIYLSGSTLFK